jgi:hypothetical protein
MTRTWKDLTNEQQLAISREFATQEAISGYSSHEAKEMRPKTGLVRPTTQALALYLQNTGSLSSSDLLPLLRSDAALKRKFEWLLSHYTLLSVASAAAAASTDSEFERPLPDGGWLRVVPSNANPQQVHLIIQLPVSLRDIEPHQLIIRLNELIYIVSLDSRTDGRVMQLMSTDDPIVTALGDARTKFDLV